MNKENLSKEKTMPELSECILGIVSELEAACKYAAVHTYTCTLHSFTEFFAATEATPMFVSEVFTVGRLKSYQEWLLHKGLSWNSISTYMRTLRAIANRIYPPGSAGYIPGLFNDVYTKVESRTKRALTERQMHSLFETNLESLPQNTQRALAYFELMFLFRGMPFIDLAHLRKQDVQGNLLTYCRHKTGKQMTFSIPKEAIPLLNKFSDKTSDSIYLFPILDSSLCNGLELHRCYLGALRVFNKNLERVSSLFRPNFKLSSYTARHTWATLAFHSGTPVGIISEGLGHSSIRVTETYLKPFGREYVDKANRQLISLVLKHKQANMSLRNLL